MDGQTAGSNVLNKEIERATEPVVRSRWSPKPEQILILESIFNSGMVNPSKDETVRIRKLLEKFGSVGDANVFYWFQNRRSRSRRRQRQIQASLATDLITSSPIPAYNTINHETTSSSSSSCSSCSSNGYLGSISGDGVNYMFPISQQMGLTEIEQLPVVSPNVYHAEVQNLQYQPEFVTVFINGVPTEIPSGSLDMRAMFGQDTLLLNSLGEPVPVNEYGISLQGLQNGENYYLVSRSI